MTDGHLQRIAQLTLVAGIVLAPSVAAAVGRIALVVGQNQGLEVATPLRYAVEDARRVASVLEELGGFDEVRLLESPDAKRLLTEVEKLRSQASLLFFYYSGHAGGGRLHLSGTEVSATALLAALERREAGLTVAVVDACESGDLTAKKGLVLEAGAPPEPEAARGRVVLASSSPGEAAQESSLLRASFFSAHLVTGLRGAADGNRDGAVAVREVYRYAYDRTVDSTLVSAAGVQRPTYEVEMSGRSDVPLTFPRRSGAHLSLQATSDGRFFVSSDDEATLLAEVPLRAEATSRIALAPGAYVVKKRGESGLLVARVSLSAGDDASLAEAEMERVPYAALRRKGERPTELFVGGRLGTGLGGVDVLGGLTAGYLVGLGPVVLGPMVSLGLGSQDTEPSLFTIATEAGLAVGLQYPGSRWRLVYGVKPSFLFLHQRVDGADSRSSVGFGGYGLLGVEAWLGDDVGISSWLEAGAAWQRQSDDPLADEAPLVPVFSGALTVAIRVRS